MAWSASLKKERKESRDLQNPSQIIEETQYKGENKMGQWRERQTSTAGKESKEWRNRVYEKIEKRMGWLLHRI